MKKGIGNLVWWEKNLPNPVPSCYCRWPSVSHPFFSHVHWNWNTPYFVSSCLNGNLLISYFTRNFFLTGTTIISLFSGAMIWIHISYRAKFLAPPIRLPKQQLSFIIYSLVSYCYSISICSACFIIFCWCGVINCVCLWCSLHCCWRSDISGGHEY